MISKNVLKLIPISILTLVLSCKKNLIAISQNPTATTTIPNPSKRPISYQYEQLYSDSASSVFFTYNFTNNPQQKTRGWQGCPTIGIEKENYFAAWFANEKDEGTGSYIVVSTREKSTNNWRSNSFMISPFEDVNRVTDPLLWNDKYGELHLSYTIVKGNWDGASGGVWHIKIKKDEDGRILITKPTRLFSGVMNVKPTFLNTDSSKMLFPVSGWNVGSLFNGLPAIPTPPDVNGALLYTSTYDPENHEILRPMVYSKIPVDNSRRFLDEHMVVTMDNDKNMICLLRTYDGITISKSTNYGLDWTRPIAFDDLGVNPASRIFFGKLKSGNLLVVYNNSKSRTNLTVCLSKDNGKTWPFRLVIEKTGDATYPEVTQNQEEEICLIYDRNGRSWKGEIILARLTEQNIINNEQNSITKITVDKF